MEVFADILEEARGGRRKTHIVYGANLNNTSFGRYRDALLAAGLLEERDDRYLTTGKGEAFLEIMARLREMVDLDA